MEIYPQNLGPESQPILQARAQYLAPRNNTRRHPRLRAGAIYGGIAAASSVTAGMMLGDASLGWHWLLVSGLGAAVITLVRPRGSDGPSWEMEPLTVYEVRDLQYGVTDTLRRPYLELVLAAIAIPPPPDREAQTRVREALRALGESVAGLPRQAEPVMWDDPAVFQAHADQLVSAAAAEEDPVVGASLHRRAEALMRQAETAARTNTLLRRNEALRQEVAGQIAALQTSLTALRVGGTQAIYELADVAASIQQVAIEAGALTQARSEIGDLVNAGRVVETTR